MDEIIKFIKSGFSVIIVNTRLASYLRMSFDTRMKDRGFDGWEASVIVPFYFCKRLNRFKGITKTEGALPGIVGFDQDKNVKEFGD